MLKIYNTIAREKQEFIPISDDQVTFYQCGPTVYSRQHIGNLFSAVKGDLIRRSLQYLGYNIIFVRNITDVGHLVSDEDNGEDKMSKSATKEGVTPQQITEKYTTLYHQDLKLLQVLLPDYETKATDYIDQMVAMIQELINNGYAYATDLAIYFEVQKFTEYNKLNGQKLEFNKSGLGHGDVSDPGKKSHYDFAIWFFKNGTHKNALQTWDRQFHGIRQNILAGFPGWHIECSAMAKSILGDTIDLHMGGREHIPVHHTNEIAQSEAANGVKFVNYWLHHEMLLLDGGKMSKSLGNIFTLDDLIEKGFEPMHYRYFLLQGQYRSKQNFTWESLTSAKNGYNNLYQKIMKLKQKSNSIMVNIDSAYNEQFILALSDDFNIPLALSVAIKLINDNSILPEVRIKTFEMFNNVLGLRFADNKLALSKSAQEIIEQRKTARENRDWLESDRLRDLLKLEFNIVVEDTAEGQKIS
jgi:cysteinyl-tRNA synthetase